MASERALLLIADISGYTDYMGSHRMSLGHAEANTARLLEKVVDAARDFDLIEIEGDAAFLSREADALDGNATLAAITEAAVAMHRAFHVERRLVELNLCPCDSCTQTSELKLKFVAHVGARPPDARDLAGPRGNRTRAHLLRGGRGPRRAPRAGAGSLLAAALRRDG